MTAQEKLVATAQGEIGYLEKKDNNPKYIYDKTANAGTNNWNKYAYDLDNIGNIFNGKKNGYDWCGVFCAWCYIQTFGVETAMKMTGFAYNGLAAGVKYAANYYKNKGRFYTSKPQSGDQIFFYGNTTDVWQHTGLVEKVDSSKVYTIEGNTTGSSGVIYNGGGVARKSYALNYSRIAGYGRPDWSIAEKEDDDDMTQEKFNEMFAVAMTSYRKSLQDNDSGSWSDADKEWAINQGLMKGSGTTSDGEPNYMWEDFLTREQSAALFHRFAESRGLE